MKHITITIDDAFHEEAKEYCRTKGMKLSALISVLLKKEMDLNTEKKADVEVVELNSGDNLNDYRKLT